MSDCYKNCLTKLKLAVKYATQRHTYLEAISRIMYFCSTDGNSGEKSSVEAKVSCKYQFADMARKKKVEVIQNWR